MGKYLLDKPIIALDYDGVLCPDNFAGEEGSSTDMYESVIQKLVAKRDKFYLILWTCRTGKSLEEAIQKCADRGLYFDSINTNYQEVFETSNKNYADYYIDDRICTTYIVDLL